MESLMREIGEEGKRKGGKAEAEGEGSADKDKENERVFKAAWEAMLVEGMDGVGGADLAGLGDLLGDGGVKGKEKGADKDGAGGGEKDDFQSKIRQTMGKLKESESNLQACPQPLCIPIIESNIQAHPQADSAPNTVTPGAPGANPDSLEALLASLGDLGLGENGEGEDEAELAGFLENMMGQLMSKEVLYEPLKELCEKVRVFLSISVPFYSKLTTTLQ
jgi:peroxin-19